MHAHTHAHLPVVALLPLPQFVIGWRFHVGAVKALRRGTANMDVLVALGTNASYFYSVISILYHHFSMHHDDGRWGEGGRVGDVGWGGCGGGILLYMADPVCVEGGKGDGGGGPSPLHALHAAAACLLLKGHRSRYFLAAIQAWHTTTTLQRT